MTCRDAFSLAVEQHVDVQLDLHHKHQRDYNYHCNNIHHLVDSHHEHLHLHHIFEQHNDNEHFNNFHIDVCNIDDDSCLNPLCSH